MRLYGTRSKDDGRELDDVTRAIGKNTGMHIHIAKTNGILWSGEADAVVAPASEGEVTILKGHVPLATTLRAGTISVRTKDREDFACNVERGVLEVTSSSVTVLL